MKRLESPSNAESLLIAASEATKVAAVANRLWGRGADPDQVGEAEADAREVAQMAIDALSNEDGCATDELPETRRGRLATAAWLLLLAGTDEHGEDQDLTISSGLFLNAAHW